MIRHRAHQVDLEVDASEASLVVVAQTYYHRWRAFVDGHAALMNFSELNPGRMGGGSANYNLDWTVGGLGQANCPDAANGRDWK